jgi:O-antigen ligase
MTNFIKFITILTIATIPIPFAAVQPWVWSFYGLMMIIVFIVGLWTRQSTLQIRINPQGLSLAVFFIWTFVLCLPLPPALLSLLNPAHATTLTKAWELTGSTPTWQAISYSPQGAFAWWIFLLSLGLFYHVVRELCEDDKTLRRIILVMIVLGLGEAIYGLIQALVPSMGVLWVDYIHNYMGTARGTFINRNNFAGFLEMIWPLALGITLSMTGRMHSIKMALNSDRLNQQALMALCIIAFLLTLILTRSRAGIICGIVGFLVFFIMARPGMQTRSKQIRIMLGGIVFLLAIYTMTIGIGPVMERFLTIESDGGSRISIWRDSLSIIRDYPLGIGLRNYEKVFAVYNHSPIVDKTVVHAHNDYLQLLIETGWVGFFALVGTIFVFLVKCARRIKHLNFRKDPLRFYLAVGAFSGIISMGVHSLFDFNLQIPANCVYFVVLMAILSACTQYGQHHLSPSSATLSES